MIAVVIVDYRSEPLTRGCISSLYALGRSDIRILVVDNSGSMDADALRRDLPEVTLIQPALNLGFGGGCNAGIRRALEDGADYCLLLNPDTVAREDFIGPLLAVMEADETIGMACPTVRDDDEMGEVAYGGGGINWWLGRPYVIRGRRLRSPGRTVDVPFVTGAAMMLRSAAVEEVGPMDEGYFLYFEDAEYSQMFLRAGWRVVYVPEPEVRHAASSVTGFQSERYVYCFARNRIRFMRRCSRWHHRLVFHLYNNLVRMPGAVVVFALFRRRPALAGAYLRGYRDGMLNRPAETFA